MKAILRTIRISPKKANLVAELVRNKSVKEAVDQLAFTPKKAAPILKKLIESAAANAENNFKQNPETLYIKEIIVNEGPTYKRSNPVSKGRAHPILKRTSHITVKLETAKTEAPTPKAAPKAAKAEAPKTEKENTPTEKAEKKEESKSTKN